MTSSSAVRLIGGAGNDTMNGGAGTDTADYSTATAGVTVNLATTAAQNTGGAGTDTLSTIENLTGSSFNDILTGDGVNNIIVGGAGNDTMNGGAGNDNFIFATGFGNDTIAGFDANPSSGQDLIQLDPSLEINAGNFNSQVVIIDLGANTLVTIGANSILLQGVDGVGANTLTIDDFRFL
jgi:Ca2+-binding RTX toxin-like protein